MQTARVLGVELLKIRKRWLPYLLLVVMLVGVAIVIWLAGYGSWQEEKNDAEFAFGGEAMRTFALPWALPALLDTGQFWGAILIGVLTASIVATEHGWGTVRQALVRGQTRSHYLSVKLMGIVLVASALLLTALGVGLGFSAIATALADLPVTFDVPDGPSAPEAGLMIVRAGYAILPYGLLAFALAIIGRSTTLGIVGTLLYMFVEAILVAILGELGGPSPTVRAFFMGHNVSALLAANRIGGGQYYSLAPRDVSPASELPDPTVAALVLALYCAIFLAIAYSVFLRRDLSS